MAASRPTGRGAKMTAQEHERRTTWRARVGAAAHGEAGRDGEKSVQEQLLDILKEHSVKLIDLFREWDDDGNGALDKKEMRRAIAALGYEAPKKEVDALFDSIDVDGSGWIEFEELKKALSEKGVAGGDEGSRRQAAGQGAGGRDGVCTDDVAGDGRGGL